MNHMIRVAGAVAASACAVTALAQAPVSPTVAPRLQAHVRNERFQPVTAVRGLPLGVREELQRLFGSTAMAVADPGEPFQATDEVTDRSLPIRRLNVAGCSPDHCLVYYERGGVARLRYALLFHWTPAATTVEAGGAAPAGLRTVDDLRNAVLSGALKGPGRFW